MKMKILLAAAALLGTSHAAFAAIVPVTFTQLTGLTGGNPAETAVFRADLSGVGLGVINSVTIMDASSMTAGSPGQFSGFDLDATVISRTNIGDASSVSTLVPAGTFDFVGSAFTPGTQAPPMDPKLFGTNATGNAVNNAVATLGVFDGNSTTNLNPANGPVANGFVSMGFGGALGINLLSPVAVSAPLFLYIGEVGNNGEVAASTITVSDTPTQTPEPGTAALIGAALVAFGLMRKRRTGALVSGSVVQ